MNLRICLKIVLSVLVYFIAENPILGQTDRYDSLQSELTYLSNEYPGLSQRVELNVSDVNLAEFLNTIALSNRLNISVDESLNFLISNNFSNATAIEVLVFLARKYDLDIKLFGSIINVSKRKPQIDPGVTLVPKVIHIEYNSDSDELSMDLKKDTLYAVAKEITMASGKNVIVPLEIENMLVTGFIQNQPFNSALEMLAYANNLKINYDQPGALAFERKEGDRTSTSSSKGTSSNRKSTKGLSGMDLKVSNGLISLSTSNLPIQDIITAVSDKLKYNYFIFSEIKGNATLNIENMTYENLLSYLLNGTDYTFKKENEIFLFGERSLEGLRAVKVFQLKFRTVDKVVDFIPAELKKGVELKAFNDLNSIILSGSQPKITELETFLTSIDRVVPVVSIEVIILEVNNTSEVVKGITAGISPTPVQTQGTVFPGLDMTISSSSINNVIDKLGGLSSLILGHVSPNFYMTLQLLETNGALKIRSTPKLSTLNGHLATLSIGQTQYYLETQNAVVGTQNPQNITTQQYKSVNADLSVNINPIVSGDEQITLEIKVKQSTFTARIAPTAPPGTTTRNFESLIRIKNEEMIMLGGLEDNTINDTGKGIPGLARVPVLNWIFGNRDRSKSKSKLVILIKPTVIY